MPKPLYVELPFDVKTHDIDFARAKPIPIPQKLKDQYKKALAKTS